MPSAPGTRFGSALQAACATLFAALTVASCSSGGEVIDPLAPPPPPDPTVPASLTGVEITPNSASVVVGTSQQFLATGRLSNGGTQAVSVTWTATGGTITTGGLYTAGGSAGTFRVIAQQVGGQFADTSVVTVGNELPPPSMGTAEPDPARATETLVAQGFNVSSTSQLGAGWISAVNEPGTSISFVPGRSGNAIRCNYPAVQEARCITEYYGWWNRQPPYALTHWVRIQPNVQMSATGNKGMRLFTGLRQASWGNEAITSIEWGGGVRIWSFNINDPDRFPGDDGQLITLNGSGNAWGIQQNVNRTVKWGQSPEQPKQAGVTYLNDGQWHRVTARVDGTTTTARVRIWVDGILITDSRPTAGSTCWNLATRTQTATNCAITGTDITHLGVVGFSFPLNIVDPPPSGAFWYDVDDLALFIPGN